MNIVCLSHLRWDFVFQRPQHLLTRAARGGRVLYIEEPVDHPGPARMRVTEDRSGVQVATPLVPSRIAPTEQREILRQLIGNAITRYAGDSYVLWCYTPMATPLLIDLTPSAIVYDCMDELSAFSGASPELTTFESVLFEHSDVVFTGGQSLYEAKRSRHPNIHAFPSSVDVSHFATARSISRDPDDVRHLPHPRIGFFGVIDERTDVELIRGVAALEPQWQLVLVGPTAKIDPATLPRAANIHYLGPKAYGELPAYLASWDVAMLPFARNDATRFISPTKTPEYLAAGKPVVSTSIRDVVRPYGERGLVRIADTPEAFVDAIRAALEEDSAPRIAAADAFLADMSWDLTWNRMKQLIEAACASTPKRAWSRAS